MSEIERCCFVLGVRADASASEMKRAYHDLVREWHPDRLQHDSGLRDQAEERLKEINVAYERLKSLGTTGHSNSPSGGSKPSDPQNGAAASTPGANPHAAYARAAGFTTDREADPNRAQRLFEEGMALFADERWKEAVSALLQSVCLKPNNSEAYYALGRCYLALQMPAKAASAFKHVMRMRPGFSEACAILGRTYIAMGGYKDAAWVCAQYLRNRPDANEVQTVMGAAYRLWNRLPQAQEALEEVIRRQPDFAEAHYELARTFLALGDKEAARKTLKTLRTLDAELAVELFIAISTT